MFFICIFKIISYKYFGMIFAMRKTDIVSMESTDITRVNYPSLKKEAFLA